MAASLQQHLPLAVLKLIARSNVLFKNIKVATALTACGIETIIRNIRVKRIYVLQQHLPLAVLKLVPNHI